MTTPLENGDTVPLNFKITNAPSAELELGLESGHSGYIFRGWAAKGISIINDANQGGVETLRIGGDLMIRGPQMGSAAFSFLLFAFGEEVTLTRSENDLATEEGDTIDDIFYTQGYAGGGIAVSW